MVWHCLKTERIHACYSPGQQQRQPAGRFSVWHHLDANGIHFKSITPLNDGLVIKFESSDQSAAAKAVLDRSLPQGYIIALQDDDSLTLGWLSRLRNSTHRLG